MFLAAPPPLLFLHSQSELRVQLTDRRLYAVGEGRWEDDGDEEEMEKGLV